MVYLHGGTHVELAIRIENCKILEGENKKKKGNPNIPTSQRPFFCFGGRMVGEKNWKIVSINYKYIFIYINIYLSIYLTPAVEKPI